MCKAKPEHLFCEGFSDSTKLNILLKYWSYARSRDIQILHPRQNKIYLNIYETLEHENILTHFVCLFKIAFIC